jgi:hypothetical protein
VRVPAVYDIVGLTPHWTVDHAGRVMLLLSPEEQTFYGKTLEEALAWCLVWLVAPEIGVGPFLIH